MSLQRRRAQIELFERVTHLSPPHKGIWLHFVFLIFKTLYGACHGAESARPEDFIPPHRGNQAEKHPQERPEIDSHDKETTRKMQNACPVEQWKFKNAIPSQASGILMKGVKILFKII